MKVITIKQPFATLIAKGLKEYEFRTWNTKYRGSILIHAGKGIDKKAMKKYEYLGLTYPIGCIIARAELTDSVLIDNVIRSQLALKKSPIYDNIINNGDWNGYGFKLEEIKEIEPISVNGKLSLWNYDYPQE